MLVLDGRDEPDVVWSADNSRQAGQITGVFHSTHKLQFQGIPAKFWGTERIKIRVGDRYSDPPVVITLSGYDRNTPMTVAVIVTLVLGSGVYYLASRGLKQAQIGDKKHNVLATLLLDRETDTYSLSKFQLYCWTAAAVFGYVYLLIARSLVQGRFEFADVPENLPALLLGSVATTAIAKGITAARGANGAGDVQPSLSDFITAGGVVSAERFQFFVWTVLGVLAFVFLTVMQGPSQFQDLPRIPEGFLYLMGASSSGYLGGKLARKPGPIIDSIVAQSGSLVIALPLPRRHVQD